MLDDLQRQALEMITHGHTPGAIIVSPPEMKRLLREAGANVMFGEGAEGSGWQCIGLPVYRCWEIGGPTVVSVDVLNAMRGWTRDRYRGDLRTQFAGTAAELLEASPLLF